VCFGVLAVFVLFFGICWVCICVFFVGGCVFSFFWL